MNRKNFFITLALVIVATAVAFVSCKKESEKSFTSFTDTKTYYCPKQVDDMAAYLREFKQKMLAGKSNETMTLDEAAWHIASVANYDYCDAGVEFTDFLFDTLFNVANLKVVGGCVDIQEIGKAYGQVANAIEAFVSSHGSENRNLRFVDARIAENGMVSVSMITTVVVLDHVWYFLDDTIYTPFSSPYSDSVCNYHFSTDSTYTWDSIATRELQRVLRLFENHTTQQGKTCFTPTRTQVFEYNYLDWLDPYGSPFHRNSRIFAEYDNSNHILDLQEMCYCLDSYLALGYDYLADNPSSYNNEHVVNWSVGHNDYCFEDHHDKCTTYFHVLTVNYGDLFTVNPYSPPVGQH